MDESFAALVRGPESIYPRGFPYLIPVWLAGVAAAVTFGWLRIIGPLPWWYAVPAAVGLIGAGITFALAMAAIRRPAFQADRNGVRLGVRTDRPRPRHRQAYLWWADVRQVRVEPRPWGLVLEISLGPGARIIRRRGPLRQALLLAGLFVMPLGLGRGLPRLTEARRRDPQYRVRLLSVTPEQLGVVLAGLAPPVVEIIVISRRDGPVLARRLQPPPAPARQRPARAPRPAGRPAAARSVAPRPAGGPPRPAGRPEVPPGASEASQPAA